ncbi:hypothetical protein JQ554_28445 [Bradyrhizobium diazoefficiens]|nr:hypothetical protein [Bradyrhizobium diazoefficiens]MBR0967863.1 hypothetical protein [Bradyrhizobium diazoefficiens]MBR0981257.1 hypothetical protein [Bradyrhizobium diazoefficiens]MBR1010714.1 hypothetical protein [Bradyrhizobium diazoefficiens]MBR1015721.1 hypothetical protein [Bradyrhizobium diazoefficiens]MBR1054707.1 hypothetical protein [Bradyrhizobium diazoefficiens]
MTRKPFQPASGKSKPTRPSQPQQECHERELLLRAAETLEAILADGLNFATELEAESVIAAIKRVMK